MGQLHGHWQAHSVWLRKSSQVVHGSCFLSGYPAASQPQQQDIQLPNRSNLETLLSGSKKHLLSCSLPLPRPEKLPPVVSFHRYQPNYALCGLFVVLTYNRGYCPFLVPFPGPLPCAPFLWGVSSGLALSLPAGDRNKESTCALVPADLHGL